MWQKGNTPPLLVGMQTCTDTLEISLIVCQKKLEIVLPEDPAISVLGIYPNDALPCLKDTMFIAALFIIARNWKQPRCPLTE